MISEEGFRFPKQSLWYHCFSVLRVTKFKINWDGGSEGASENSENVPPPKRDPNQLSENSQELLKHLLVINSDAQSMDAPLKTTNGLSASAPMEIE